MNDTHQSYILNYYLDLGKKIASGELSPEEFAELQTKLQTEMEKRIYTDGLVENFLNNKGTSAAIEQELAVAKRLKVKTCLLALDIDRLKRFNDSNGHVMGDKLIKTYGEVIFKNSRMADIRGRVGGDEFVLFLMGTDIEMAKVVAERIRKDIILAVKEAFPEWEEDQTVSIGIAGTLEDDTPATLREKADQALYEAKKIRNSTSIHIQPS